MMMMMMMVVVVVVVERCSCDFSCAIGVWGSDRKGENRT
jgi:hypothetical protein